MTSYWLSCKLYTVRVDVDDKMVIRQAAPIVKRFVGQPLADLVRWQRDTRSA